MIIITFDTETTGLPKVKMIIPEPSTEVDYQMDHYQ